MLLADVLIDAVDASLEDGKISFNGICVPEGAAYIFLDGMVYRAMACKLATNADLVARLIGHKVGLTINLGH